MTRRDRLPPIPPDQLTDDQRAVAEELVSGPRGAVIGPFVATLRSPELTRRLQRLGEYIRYDSILAPKLREMAILLTAREWRQDFEWEVHAPLAEKAGLDAAILAAIVEHRALPPSERGETVVYNVFAELHKDGAVSDATFRAAVEELGEQGVVDLIALIGYYTTLAMIMNVAQTPAASQTFRTD
jgi:4-carboxymuconolactone decarboxylase